MAAAWRCAGVVIIAVCLMSLTSYLLECRASVAYKTKLSRPCIVPCCIHNRTGSSEMHPS